jgi:hypothetical protein
MEHGEIWETLLARLESECGAGKRVWHQYSKKVPAALRVKKGERTIVYLSPGADGFLASFAMGAGALALVREAGFGHLLEGAKKYAEGTAVRVRVREVGDLEGVLALAAAKIRG